MKLSVVIPVFNEEKTISQLLLWVGQEKTPKEVIIVDDGSTDGTREAIEAFNLPFGRQKNKELKRFYHPTNKGKGAAVRTGIKNATGEVLIVQDADLEYHPRYYQKLLAPILAKKTKVVYGSRLKEMEFKLWGENKTPLPIHYLANYFLSKLTNWLYGSHLTDMETGYKAMTREVYQSLRLESDGFEIEPEMTAKILKQGYKIVEVPITTKPRGYHEGKKIKTRDAFMAFWTLWRYFR